MSPFGGSACSGYGARASSTKAYHALSMDVLARWLLPLGPSGFLPGPLGTSAASSGGGYALRAGHCYVHTTAKLIPEPQSELRNNKAPHQTLGSHILIGPQSQVSSSASVERSVLGSSVTVSSRAIVRGSLVHDDVVIGKNCEVLDSVLGQGVKLLDGTKLGQGCLIEAGVTLGPDVELRSGSRVGLQSAATYDEDEDEDDEGPTKASSQGAPSTAASKELGAQAVGQLWPFLGESSAGSDGVTDDEDEDGDDSPANGWRNLLMLRIGASPAQADQLARDVDEDEGLFDEDDGASLTEEELLGAGEEEESSEEEDDDEDEAGVMSARPSLMHSRSGTNAISSAGTATDGSSASAATIRRLLDFRSEATASLSRALAENHTLDNASIELKTLRMASNVTLLELRATVLASLMGAAERAMRGSGGVAAFGKVWSRWGGLIKAVASEVADQVQVVTILQVYCATHPESTKLFVPTLKLFYNEDIVEDEAIIEWWRSPASRSAAPTGITAPGHGVTLSGEGDGDEEASETVEAGEEEMKSLRASAEPVLRFIVESQEDEDEDEEEDESDEEDDD